MEFATIPEHETPELPWLADVVKLVGIDDTDRSGGAVWVAVEHIDTTAYKISGCAMHYSDFFRRGDKVVFRPENVLEVRGFND